MTDEQQIEKDVEGSGRDLILKNYPFTIAEHLNFFYFTFTVFITCVINL
jgi:hypothetical protein